MKKTSEQIDKYFNALRDESNLSAKKYNTHHIKPCFTFKDKTHSSREETEPLANKMKENLIKVSIYNHIKAHYFLKYSIILILKSLFKKCLDAIKI